MPRPDTLPSPELLEEYSQFFRLLSEPARLQLLCLLKQKPKRVIAPGLQVDVGAVVQALQYVVCGNTRILGLVRNSGDKGKDAA